MAPRAFLSGKGKGEKGEGRGESKEKGKEEKERRGRTCFVCKNKSSQFFSVNRGERRGRRRRRGRRGRGRVVQKISAKSFNNFVISRGSWKEEGKG